MSAGQDPGGLWGQQTGHGTPAGQGENGQVDDGLAEELARAQGQAAGQGEDGKHQQEQQPASAQDDGPLTQEQQEQIRQQVEAERAAWRERFRLRTAGGRLDPQALLARDRYGRIDTYRTAELMLPRSDQMSATVLKALSGDLFHYGTQYREWLAWDDEIHIHATDARDVVGRFIQRYAVTHAEALRLIKAPVEQKARADTANLHREMKAAEAAAASAAQGTDMKAAAAAAGKAEAARKAFSTMWDAAMTPYEGVFKRHRAFRDKLWGKRTKADIAGELKTLLAEDMGTFDTEPSWLVCDNGVVEVQVSHVRDEAERPHTEVVFKLLTHDPSRLVTKRLGRGVIFNPQARCPAWEAFLASTVKDEADRRFLQRRIGAALAGIRLKDFLNLIGKPDSGKTTFSMVMKALFGSYFASPDVSVFMTSGDPQPWDLDLCRGARYVYAAEPEPGSRFRDGMVKRLTGGDPVESARKYGHPVTWDPQCLIAFATNHPIFFDTSDAGMFGRATPIEFTYSGPKDEGLRGKLLAELPGIFTWALLGLHGYLTGGIEVTPSIADLRERIAMESDPALRFLAAAISAGHLGHDKARTAPTGRCVLVSRLYPKFTAWCVGEGVRNVAGKHQFNKRIERIYPQQDSHGMRFRGLLPGPRFTEPIWLDPEESWAGP
jgi:P4 family phage/plasmid primase-like protien